MSNQSSNAPIAQAEGPSSFIQVWIKALTKPSEGTFADMAASPKAKASTAYLWVFIAVIFQFFLLALVQGAAVRNALQQQGLGGDFAGGGFGSALITALCGAPIIAVFVVVFFAIWTALTQWIARLFGGMGTFNAMAYAFGAIAAPFSLISAVLTALAAIPYIGFCFSIISSLAGLYALVLDIMAVKGVNRFGWGPAIGAVLIPWLAIVFVIVCIAGLALLALGPAISDVFQQIQQGITPY